MTSEECPCCCCVRLCADRNYDYSDFSRESGSWLKSGYFCVLDDPEDLPEDAARCCNFKRSSRDKRDCGFGYYGEEQGKSKKRLQRMSTQRMFRLLMITQFVAFIFVGMFLMIDPEKAAQNLLYNSDYQVRTEVDRARERYEALGGDASLVKVRTIAEEASATENAEISLLSNVLKSLEGVLLTSQENDAKSVALQHQQQILQSAEKTLREAALQEAQRIAAQQPQELTVTSFTAMFGAMCLAFASMSVMAYASTSNSDIQTHIITSMIVYGCLISALSTSSTRKAAGNESTSFMLWSFFFCLTMLVSWIFIYNRVRSEKFEDREKKLKKTRDKALAAANNSHEVGVHETLYGSTAHAVLSSQVDASLKNGDFDKTPSRGV